MEGSTNADWIRFAAPASGTVVVALDADSLLDKRIAVYEADVDAGPLHLEGQRQGSSISTVVVAGREYFVRVDAAPGVVRCVGRRER